MNLSQKKAEEAFRPWWDVISRFGAVASLAICTVLFFSIVSNSEQEIIVEDASAEVVGVEPDVDYNDSLAIDAAFDLDDGDGDPSSSSGSGSGGGNVSTEVKDSLMRIKQELLAAADDPAGDRVSFVPFSIKRSSAQSSAGPFHAAFVVAGLVMASAMLLLDVAFCRLFYSHQLLQASCCILESIGDPSRHRGGAGCCSGVDSGSNSSGLLLFSSSLHHSSDKRSLARTFDAFNCARLVLAVFFLVVTASAVASVDDQYGIHQVQYLLGVFLCAVLALKSVLLCCACAWPRLTSRTLWGRLMATYARTVEKLDVVRGRCVPAPPYGGRSAGQVAAAAGGKLGKRGRSSSSSRVLESLNPYAANDNMRLVLDLVALRCGVGTALKFLAHLEVDVQNNWSPFKVEVGVEPPDDYDDVEEEDGDVERRRNTLNVAWKDPLAILYLAPVPKELQLHFALEVTFEASAGVDPVVEVVGYDDTRYYRQMWRAADPGSVEVGPAAKVGEPLSYLEVFEDLVPPGTASFVVDVWTMIDGHLIAKSSVHYGSAGAATWGGRPNALPKPPRQQISKCSQCSEEERAAAKADRGVEVSVQPPTDEDDDDEEEEADSGKKSGHRAFRRMSVKEIVLTPAASSVFDFTDDDEEGEDREVAGRRETARKKDRAKSLTNLQVVKDARQESEEALPRMKKSRSYGARMQHGREVAAEEGNGRKNKVRQRRERRKSLKRTAEDEEEDDEEAEEEAVEASPPPSPRFRRRAEGKKKKRQTTEMEEDEEDEAGRDNCGYEDEDEGGKIDGDVEDKIYLI